MNFAVHCTWLVLSRRLHSLIIADYRCVSAYYRPRCLNNPSVSPDAEPNDLIWNKGLSVCWMCRMFFTFLDFSKLFAFAIFNILFSDHLPDDMQTMSVCIPFFNEDRAELERMLVSNAFLLNFAQIQFSISFYHLNFVIVWFDCIDLFAHWSLSASGPWHSTPCPHDQRCNSNF